MTRFVVRALTAVALILPGIAVASPVHAATASPASVVVDCGITGGAVDTTITGRVGDTMTIMNTSATTSCTFAGYAGVVTATNLTSGTTLPATSSSIITIVAAGAFTITPGVGVAQGTMTVVIGDPNPAPEYTITFDANGGNCSSNPLVLTVASGDWYAVPTEGTGAFQCHREDYILTGWSHGSTIVQAGGADVAPDVAVTPAESSAASAHAKAADHATLFAVWKPKGVEIVYDANVAAADTCLDSTGADLALAERTTDRTVFYAGRGDTIASKAPCSPIDATGELLPFRGWAVRGDGPAVIKAGEPLADVPFSLGNRKALYAVWATPDPRGGMEMRVGEDVTIRSEVVGANLSLQFIMDDAPNAGWIGLTFHEFMFPGDSIVVSWDGETDGGFALDTYNPGIPTLVNFPAPLQDTNPILRVSGNPLDNRDNVELTESETNNGVRSFTVSRPLQTGDIFDFQIVENEQFHVVAAYGTDGAWQRGYDAQQPMHTAVAADMWVVE